MSKVSVIISARNEKPDNLYRTLKSVYDNAKEDIEVIIGFNGYPHHTWTEFPDLIVIGEKENIGLKPMLNQLAKEATGDYLFKLDAHCRVGKDWDKVLKADMEDDWLVMPRFKIIKNDWTIQEKYGQEEFYDYFYLSCPFTDKKGLRFKAGGHWGEKSIDMLNKLIDETPQIHGSGWFVNRNYYLDNLMFPNIDPFGHAQEPIWLALRNWLIGGKVMVNKNTWYAHLHQNSKDRGYPEDKKATEETYNLTAKHFLLNREPNLEHNFEWFVEKFMPMPSWPENWRDLLIKWRING